MVMFTPQYQPTTTDSPCYFPFLHPATLLPILLQSAFPFETQQIKSTCASQQRRTNATSSSISLRLQHVSSLASAGSNPQGTCGGCRSRNDSVSWGSERRRPL